jgi:hypothetical protein
VNRLEAQFKLEVSARWNSQDRVAEFFWQRDGKVDSAHVAGLVH